MNTDRSFEDLALLYEHFLNENGNRDAHASDFRGCLPEDYSFENGKRIGFVLGQLHAALRYWLDHTHGNAEETKIVKELNDDIMASHATYQSITEALDILAEKHFAL